MRRICKYCGATYDGDPGGSCCPSCAAAHRAVTLRERVCKTCGALFLGGPRAWYCPTCRAERRKEADRRAKRNGAARPLGSTDLCEICGKPYTVNSGRQRYCPDCAPEAIRTVDNAQSRAWAAEHTTPEQRREARRAAAASIPCAVCGRLFVPTSAALTCSEGCSRELAKQRAQTWEGEHREERNADRRERYRQKLERMTPEERAEHRERVNARARENYKKRQGRQ